MKKTILIHNPQCSKSRSASEILKHKNISFQELLYLETQLSSDFILELATMLNLNVCDMIRKNDEKFKEVLGLCPSFNPESANNQEWARLVSEYPFILERPIFIHMNKAVIARPPERVLEIL